MTFGEKLSKLRKENNYTQEQLAQILGVSRQSVSKWESDTSYPETDKLICMARMFNCSTDYLLLDSNEISAKQSVIYNSKQSKIIGYILFAISVLSMVLIVVLAKSFEDLYISLPIAVAGLICSIICMFVKQKSGYWCLWVMIIPLVSLSPYIVGFPLFSSTTIFLVIFVIFMIFVARKVFDGARVTTSKKKTVLIIVAWLSVITLRIFSFGFTLSSESDFLLSLSPYMFVSILLYVAIALLTTYTVCYVKSFK